MSALDLTPELDPDALPNTIDVFCPRCGLRLTFEVRVNAFVEEDNFGGVVALVTTERQFHDCSPERFSEPLIPTSES